MRKTPYSAFIYPLQFRMPPEILTRLRSATDATHQALHTHPLLLPLTGNSATEAEYVRVLRCFYGFYAPLENNILNSTLAADYRAHASPSVSWLIEDLRFYHQPLEEVAACQALPWVGDLADLLGFLYVKEGSLLGGRVILKHLSTSLPARQSSFRFFSGLGENTGRHWQEFVAMLDTHSQTLEPAVICASASRVFEYFHRWVDVCYLNLKDPAELPRD